MVQGVFRQIFYIQMEPQKTVDYSQNYNQILTTLLPTQQVKHLAFFRLDQPKIVCHQGEQLKIVSGLATATKQTLRLYAIYEQTLALELGSWRLHEDVKQLVGWDKLILINTGQRIVGLRLEGNTLRNTFMLSLQFLPLDDLDNAYLYPDRVGNFMLIKVKNYLIYCLSETLIFRFKRRPVQRQKYQIVGQQVLWNDHEVARVYLAEVIKIRLSDFGFGNADKITISEDITYMRCNKGRQNAFYIFNILNFFVSAEGQFNQESFIHLIGYRDQPPPKSQVLITHPKPSSISADFLFVSQISPFTISLRCPQDTFQVAQYENPIKVFAVPVSMFPILVWQVTQKRFALIDKMRTFQDQYQFNKTVIAEDLYAEKVIYRDGLVVICSCTGVILINRQGKKNTIHTSIGNIIDFHVSKDLIFIENYQKTYTRLYQMSRSPRIDPRPFVTHNKKMTLEKMSNLESLFSICIGSQVCQEILAVKRQGLYNFYRDNGSEFENILQQSSQYFQFQDRDQRFLILRSADGTQGKVASYDGNQYYLSPIQWEGWPMQQRRCNGSYLSAYSGTHWHFFNFFTQDKNQFEISIVRPNNKFIDSFINFRLVSSDKSLKGHQLLELYLCFSDCLQVWLLDLTKNDRKLIYQVKNLAEGCPFLSNQLNHERNDFQRDRYRSITCPQYVMSQHGLRPSQARKANVIASQAYFSKDKNLLLFVTSTHQLLVYKIYFSLEASGIIMRRICTPLNVVKNFIWDEKRSFKQIGNKVIRAGNFLFYKGQLLESIQNTTLRSFFRMEGKLWVLQSQNKIRQVQLGSQVRDGFWLKEIECALKEQLMGLESTTTPNYYCVYNRKGFEIFKRQHNSIQSYWHCQLGNETIVTIRTFNQNLAMSYYDYFRDQEGKSDPQSVRFRFRVYNCTTKNKIVEREKPLDEPILHIRYMHPGRLLLVTSSVIFINLLKEDKTLESFRAHNFTAKRSFLTAFAHIPDTPPGPGTPGRPTYMLFGGAHGGLGFYVGKWIEEEKLKEVWYEGFRCAIRHVNFFNFGEEREEQLRALVVDDESNLLVLGLKVDRAEKISDIRLGANINSVKSRSGEGKYMFLGLSDGSIKILSTVKLQNPDENFLQSQRIFCQQMPFVGGFNLRTSRQIQQSFRSARLVSKGNVVDCDLLQQLFSLTNTLRQHMIEQTEMEPSVLKSLIPL